MRVHQDYASLQAWVTQHDALRDLVDVDFLTAIRIEPVSRARRPGAFVDLHFTDGERAVTVPLVFVDLAKLDVREADPLVFPATLASAVGDARAAAIVERVFGDLEVRALRGFFAEEAIVYRPDVAGLFERARAAGLFGAAPLAVSLPRIAPLVYARRFTATHNVVTFGPFAPEAAAFVRAGAYAWSVLDADDLTGTWYGTAGAAPELETIDVAIGRGPCPVAAATIVSLDGSVPGTAIGVAPPAPADVMLSFDPADGEPPATFTIPAAREPFVRAWQPLSEPATLGGSSGRIALVVRPDADVLPDADTDEAAALAAVLRREGFSPAIVSGIDELDDFRPDLVHLFGVRPGTFARRVADWAGEHRVPLAVHAYFEQPAAGGYWGALVAPYCFDYSADDRNVAEYLDMLRRRAVEVDGIGANTPFAPALAALDDAERVLRSADIVYVNSERELAFVGAMRANRPTYVVSPMPLLAVEEEDAGAYVGADPFVLVHAPIGPINNQLMLARAAAAVKAPIVFTGAVDDPAYAERLREFAPEGAMVFGDLPPSVLARAYRTAAVVADATWSARGHARMLTAADRGAAVVLSQSRWLDLPEAARWLVDPASVDSIARGIGEAWDAAIRCDEGIALGADAARDALRTAGLAVIAGYAKIPSAV